MEDSLIRYGELAKRKKQIAAEIDENTYSPKINQASPRTTRYTPTRKLYDNLCRTNKRAPISTVINTGSPLLSDYPIHPHTTRNYLLQEGDNRSHDAIRTNLLKEADQILKPGSASKTLTSAKHEISKEDLKILNGSYRSYAQISQVRARSRGKKDHVI